MFDMEVIKQLLHAGVGELAPIVALEYLGSMLLEKWPGSTSSTFSVFFWVIGKSQAYLEKQSMSIPSVVVAPCPFAHINQVYL